MSMEKTRKWSVQEQQEGRWPAVETTLTGTTGEGAVPWEGVAQQGLLAYQHSKKSMVVEEYWALPASLRCSLELSLERSLELETVWPPQEGTQAACWA